MALVLFHSINDAKMYTSAIYQASYQRTRLPIDHTWMIVVVLLSGLFAAAACAALAPHPVVDAAQAAIEGGL